MELTETFGNIVNFEFDPLYKWNVWTSGSITYGDISSQNTRIGSELEIKDIAFGIDRNYSRDYLIGRLSNLLNSFCLSRKQYL